MAQYQLPRGVFPQNYGDLLRANQLGEGLSWGGSELNARDDISQGQIAQALGLAVNPPAPAAPTISNQDVMRFMAQQNGGIMPGLLPGGEDAPGTGAEVGTPSGAPGGTPGAPSVGGTGSISDLSNLPEVTDVNGRSAIAQALDAAVNGINSPLGQTALDLASITGFGAVPAFAGRVAGRLGSFFGFGGPRPEPNVLGNKAEQEAFEAAPPSFRGTTPEAENEFAQQRSGERAPEVTVVPPEVNEAREDAPPQAPPPSVPDAPPAAPPDVPDITETGDTGIGGPSGPGGSGGPGGGAPSGPGGGTASGPSGDSSDAEALGGSITRRPRHPVMVKGSFKGAPKFSGGGPVSERQARLNRIAAFEKVHGTHPI